MDNKEFFMKVLIPKGKGGFYVHRFIGETLQDVQRTHDELQSEGWADATREEYDNFLSAAEAVGEIAGNLAEWARIEDLSPENKRLVRKLVAGEDVSIEDRETPEPGPSEEATPEA